MTTLTGIDPSDPLVRHRREFKVAAGESSGSGSRLPILLYVLKTSAGGETAALVGDPVEDDADAVTRLGIRSLGLWCYRRAAKAAANAPIYLCVVAEDGSSTVATRTVTLATAASGDTTATIEWGGERATFGVSTGDTAIVQAAAFAAAWNQASAGSWPAVATIGANPNEHVITLTTQQKGVDAAQALGLIRVSYRKSVATTVTLGSVSGGSGDHDYTAALAAARVFGQGYYHAFSCTATTTPTATDNGLGECASWVAEENSPTYGRNAVGIFGLRGTQAEGTTVATTVNSVWTFLPRQENSPWYTGMLAAYLAGVMWSRQIADPGDTLDDYANSDSTPWILNSAYLQSDWATESELRADANNGIIGIETRPNGQTRISRFVTSRSMTSSGGTDYRARPGKIPRVVHFFWDTIASKWMAKRSAAANGGSAPRVADDPPRGSLPLPGTVYPQDMAAIMRRTITDFCGPAPLGVYPAPILDPSVQQAMLDSVNASKDAPGSIGAECSIAAVESLVKSGTIVREVSAGY